MLSDNIKTIRKSKGLSQEELAVRLNVVRQTLSKWERGLSVPDSDMLICLSEALGTSVSTLLGETVISAGNESSVVLARAFCECREDQNPAVRCGVLTAPESDDLKAISEKLERINWQLAKRKIMRRKMFHWLLISLCVVIAVIFAVLTAFPLSYLGWDYSDPETAVVGVAFHAFEWLFVRLAPIAFIAAAVGVLLTQRKA